MIVKVHNLPMRVILDDNNSLSSRDVIIEPDVLLAAAGAFGLSPETAYWANVREGCKDANHRDRTAEHHSSGSTIKCVNYNGQIARRAQ